MAEITGDNTSKQFNVHNDNAPDGQGYTQLPHLSNVVILDYEASSTSAQSYPIEVGLAFWQGLPQSHLIKPAAEKGWTEWDDHVEEHVHRISRETLEQYGQNPREVALWLNEQLRGKVVLCDSPKAKLDNFWNARLYKLFEVAEIEPEFEIECMYDYVNQQDPVLEMAYNNVGEEREEPTHRAGEDAGYLMRLLRRFCEIARPDLVASRERTSILQI
tara:strand:- start:690 stop:1340 length:651 start_codon:yes stop_codon:yes gene_type:complete